MTTTSLAVAFTVIGGNVPSDELLDLLADILLDLAENEETE
jgi:hypothetical protein